MTRALLTLCAIVALAPGAVLGACPPPCSLPNNCWPNDCSGAAQEIQSDHAQGDQDIHDLVREYIREDVGGDDSLEGWMKDDFFKEVVEAHRMAAQQAMSDTVAGLGKEAAKTDVRGAQNAHNLGVEAARAAALTYALDDQTGDSLLGTATTLMRGVPHALDHTRAQAKRAVYTGVAIAVEDRYATLPDTPQAAVQVFMKSICTPGEIGGCENTDPDAMTTSVDNLDLDTDTDQKRVQFMAYAYTHTACPHPMLSPRTQNMEEARSDMARLAHVKCLTRLRPALDSLSERVALTARTTFDDLPHMYAALEAAGVDDPAVLLDIRDGKVSPLKWMQGVATVYSSANTGARFASLNEAQASRLEAALEGVARYVRDLTRESENRTSAMRIQTVGVKVAQAAEENAGKTLQLWRQGPGVSEDD
jgi:putative hemolysin